MIVLFLLIAGCLVSDKFLSLTNLVNILDAVSYLGILASGMALVTYCGQSVDLSTPGSYTHLILLSQKELRCHMRFLLREFSIPALA